MRENGRTARPARRDDPVPVLKAGALYLSDNGRLICRDCAGMTALYTGHDISGQPVDRVTVDDVAVWETGFDGFAGRPMVCDGGCLTLAPIAGPDGWPAVRA